MLRRLSILTSLVLFISSCAQPTAAVFTATPPATETQPAPTAEVQPTPTAVEATAALPTGTPTLAATEALPVEPVAGIHINNLTSADQVSIVKGSGSVWTRFDDFQWDRIEPVRTDPPTYRWEEVDEAGLKNAAEAGLQTIGIIMFTPDWAQKVPGVACGPVAEASLDAFAQFTNALVARYSQPPFNVRYWEIGNEPDVDFTLVDPHSGFGCWGDNTDPYYGGKYYAKALKRVYPQMKAADPAAQVLVGGLLLYCDPNNPPEKYGQPGQLENCQPSRFLEGVLQNEGGGYFDGVSYHAYDYYLNLPGQYGNDTWHSSWNTTGPILVAKARYLKNLLAAYQANDKYLVNTEVAMICLKADGSDPLCQNEDFERTKAAYLTIANVEAIAEGVRANIWYSLLGWRASGLMAGLGSPASAYTALQFNTQELSGATFAGAITDFPGLKGYAFNQDGKRIWVIWSLDGTRQTILTESAPAAVKDTFGQDLGPASALEIGGMPVYVEWAQ